MRVVYIAGPYRDPRGEWYVEQNRRAAERAALEVWAHGGVAVCPHLNTALFGGAHGLDDSVWLAGDLELLRRCDAVYAVWNWQESEGAAREVRLAREMGKPTLLALWELIEYLGKSAAAPELPSVEVSPDSALGVPAGVFDAPPGPEAGLDDCACAGCRASRPTGSSA